MVAGRTAYRLHLCHTNGTGFGVLGRQAPLLTCQQAGITMGGMLVCWLQVVVARDVMSPLVDISDGNGAASCPIMPLVSTKVAPGRAASYSSPAASSNPAYYSSTLSLRTTAISLHDILDENPADLPPRKTKIVCTLGPACWSEEGLGELLDAGLNVARFNFSHGDHEGHTQASASSTEGTYKQRGICFVQCIACGCTPGVPVGGLNNTHQMCERSVAQRFACDWCCV
jgi:hypothetical protein